MQETIKLLVGVLLVLAGFPIGNFLAKLTNEELKEGQKYFKILILLGGIGAIASLILKNDYLMFTFLFVAIVTSRSLKKKA